VMWRLRTVLQNQIITLLISAVVIPLLLLPLGPALTTRPWLVGILVVVGVAVALALGQLLAWRRRRNQPLASDVAFEVRRRGMVITLSTGPYDTSVCKTVVERQPELSHVGLLVSRDMEVKPELNQYRQALDGRGVLCRVQSCDEQDLDDIVRAVGHLLDWLDRQEVPRSAAAVELTQGTTPMSLGAYLAAEAAGVDCQYLASEVRPDGSRDRSLPPRGLLLTRRT
jgi:hypothetical protein